MELYYIILVPIVLFPVIIALWCLIKCINRRKNIPDPIINIVNPGGYNSISTVIINVQNGGKCGHCNEVSDLPLQRHHQKFICDKCVSALKECYICKYSFKDIKEYYHEHYGKTIISCDACYDKNMFQCEVCNKHIYTLCKTGEYSFWNRYNQRHDYMCSKCHREGLYPSYYESKTPKKQEYQLPCCDFCCISQSTTEFLTEDCHGYEKRVKVCSNCRSIYPIRCDFCNKMLSGRNKGDRYDNNQLYDYNKCYNLCHGCFKSKRCRGAFCKKMAQTTNKFMTPTCYICEHITHY